MKQKIKRTLALLLAILIFSGSLPVTALATSDGGRPVAITESIAQEPAADPPQGIAPEESAPPSSSTDTGGDSVPPASSLPPDSSPTSDSPPPVSSVPPASESSPQDSSSDSTASSGATSLPAQSESTSQDVSSSSAESDATQEPAQEEENGFVPLEITEMSTTFAGVPGDVVDFFVKLNREDVQVQYQWQRLYTGKTYDGEGEAIHNYGRVSTVNTRSFCTTLLEKVDTVFMTMSNKQSKHSM